MQIEEVAYSCPDCGAIATEMPVKDAPDASRRGLCALKRRAACTFVRVETVGGQDVLDQGDLNV